MLSNCGAGEDSESPLDCKEIKLILGEFNLALEGLMLKLKLQYFGPLMRRTNSLEKTLLLGKIEGKRRRDWQRIKWLDGITDSTMDMNLSKLQKIAENRGTWHSAVHRVKHDLTTEQQCLVCPEVM